MQTRLAPLVASGCLGWGPPATAAMVAHHPHGQRTRWHLADDVASAVQEAAEIQRILCSINIQVLVQVHAVGSSGILAFRSLSS